MSSVFSKLYRENIFFLFLYRAYGWLACWCQKCELPWNLFFLSLVTVLLLFFSFFLRTATFLYSLLFAPSLLLSREISANFLLESFFPQRNHCLTSLWELEHKCENKESKAHRNADTETGCPSSQPIIISVNPDLLWTS